MSMRRGAKQNALLNSPIVRGFIKPIMATLPASTPSTLPPPTRAEKEQFLISTQPVAVAEGKDDDEEQGVEEEEEVLERPQKKRRTEGEDEVVVNYTAETIPASHKKYWAQRTRLFSAFSGPPPHPHLDLAGWYSITPESIAVQIAERCRSSTIVDLFCGVGGNAIQFAFTCEKVIAVDNDPTRLECAKWNARIYGVEDRIEWVLGDGVQWVKDHVNKKEEGTLKEEEEVEVMFLSPPWGGMEYLSAGRSPLKPTTTTAATTDADDTETPLDPPYPLSALQPLHGKTLFDLCRRVTPHVAYYLPRNVNLVEVAELVKEGEKVEIEEEWMSGKLKAVTAYFGELAVQKQ
ncbi:trimethylguanosine synthase [Pseudohyphozyma bogoriensis]|nr:trimethylguanosine synthase [Pseudohyphozyma bogoriensis]